MRPSLLNLHSSCGLPLCLSGITNPLTLSQEMADHDLRREAIKKQKTQRKRVSHADQEMGIQTNVSEMVREMREEEDLQVLVNVLSFICLQQQQQLLLCPAKAA